MRLFVIRHVTAGDRSRWKGADDDRPASKKGRRQAVALADRLEGEHVSALISSPALRCVQTLEPLADRLGLKVEIDERLAEESSVADVLSVARDAPDRAVLCSHGDVVPDLIGALSRRGMEVTTPPDWRKATLWVLDGDDAERHATDGELLFSRAAVEPPPATDSSP
jgi:8-oxo-dGTP diphosphatase